MTFITTSLKKVLTLNSYLLTHSLAYERKSEDVYEKVFMHKHLFDFSNFSKDSKFYDNQNEMVVGKMKIVHRRIPINKFVGSKSKMHSMLSDDGFTTEFHEFRDTLFNKKIIRNKMKRIQSKKHKLGTYEINKTSLSCFDDKRFVLNDGIHTLAYFYIDIDLHK